ncbi:hypothetical protein [Cytobacillus oceanisediminis]|uniref:hypothetical protein n=1 Tax=Cytobacillus oceanisediminis TaxID=665099 RepID=UPI00254BD5F4|nr:hypothetical protein [Cytobacillus oceanisediminis]MDK7669280.1 hypothetical protein [Cytobacillus oceanisediminis]
MKKAMLYAGLSALILSACADKAEESPKEVVKKEPEVEEKVSEPVEEVVEESAEVEKVEAEKVTEETTETEDAAATLPTEITLNDFNAKFTQDTEETQYPGGKFQLQDGTTVQADYLFYSENDVFDYALAIFHDGKLADIQIETSNSLEELEEGLGVSFSSASVKPYTYGYEVNFNDQFSEGNISIYPNEWD